MKTRFFEAIHGDHAGSNWGKFMVAEFDNEEWSRRSIVGGTPMLRERGWTDKHYLVVDLQTGEGAIVRHGGHASADLQKHSVWVCPMFEPFLAWLYAQDDPMNAPQKITIPDAAFDFAGYRRQGQKGRAIQIAREWLSGDITDALAGGDIRTILARAILGEPYREPGLAEAILGKPDGDG